MAFDALLFAGGQNRMPFLAVLVDGLRHLAAAVLHDLFGRLDRAAFGASLVLEHIRVTTCRRVRFG